MRALAARAGPWQPQPDPVLASVLIKARPTPVLLEVQEAPADSVTSTGVSSGDRLGGADDRGVHAVGGRVCPVDLDIPGAIGRASRSDAGVMYVARAQIPCLDLPPAARIPANGRPGRFVTVSAQVDAFCNRRCGREADR